MKFKSKDDQKTRQHMVPLEASAILLAPIGEAIHQNEYQEIVVRPAGQGRLARDQDHAQLMTIAMISLILAGIGGYSLWSVYQDRVGRHQDLEPHQKRWKLVECNERDAWDRPVIRKRFVYAPEEGDGNPLPPYPDGPDMPLPDRGGEGIMHPFFAGHPFSYYQALRAAQDRSEFYIRTSLGGCGAGIGCLAIMHYIANGTFGSGLRTLLWAITGAWRFLVCAYCWLVNKPVPSRYTPPKATKISGTEDHGEYQLNYRVGDPFLPSDPRCPPNQLTHHDLMDYITDDATYVPVKVSLLNTLYGTYQLDGVTPQLRTSQINIIKAHMEEQIRSIASDYNDAYESAADIPLHKTKAGKADLARSVQRRLVYLRAHCSGYFLPAEISAFEENPLDPSLIKAVQVPIDTNTIVIPLSRSEMFRICLEDKSSLTPHTATELYCYRTRGVRPTDPGFDAKFKAWAEANQAEIAELATNDPGIRLYRDYRYRATVHDDYLSMAAVLPSNAKDVPACFKEALVKDLILYSEECLYARNV